MYDRRHIRFQICSEIDRDKQSMPVPRVGSQDNNVLDACNIALYCLTTVMKRNVDVSYSYEFLVDELVPQIAAASLHLVTLDISYGTIFTDRTL